MDFYNSAIDAFRQSPLLGIGVGSNYSWQLTYPELAGQESRGVHSVYFLVLSELGICGLILFLIIIFLWMKYLVDRIRDSSCPPFFRIISLAFFAYEAGYLVYIFQVGEFEEFEIWFAMAITSAIKSLNMQAIGMVNDPSKRRAGRIGV
jgi:O-antigen ligase